MSLTYHSDFWTFYKLNTKELDKILWSVAWKFKNVMEPEDLKDEIILRMHRSEFLNKYDSSKSQIGTYVTYQAQKHARHAVDVELVRKNHYPQVMVQELNGSCDVSDERELLPQELIEVPNEEDRISYDRLVSEVTSKLDGFSRRILRYRQNGYSIEEITKKIGTVSFPYIGHKCVEIKEMFLKASRRQKLDLPPVENKPKNGHRAKKLRDLKPSEKEQILRLFLANNGQMTNDLCVKFKATLPIEIGVFQITGYIVNLHRQVAKGSLQVRDMQVYNQFMKKHRSLWSTYKSKKYRMRSKDTGAV